VKSEGKKVIWAVKKKEVTNLQAPQKVYGTAGENQ
jgi:hypothetical protein